MCTDWDGLESIDSLYCGDSRVFKPVQMKVIQLTLYIMSASTRCLNQNAQLRQKVKASMASL